MIDKTNFVRKDNYDWELPNSGKFFWDKQVVVYVTTKTDSDHPDREIFKEQIETLNIILPSWEELSTIIEQEIVTYERKTKVELLGVINQPTIWLKLDYDTYKPEANHQWSFVLGVTESEDFGWHVEFEGKTHLDTWAGG